LSDDYSHQHSPADVRDSHICPARQELLIELVLTNYGGSDRKKGVIVPCFANVEEMCGVDAPLLQHLALFSGGFALNLKGDITAV
jgi:hypothetical protein